MPNKTAFIIVILCMLSTSTGCTHSALYTTQAPVREQLLPLPAPLEIARNTTAFADRYRDGADTSPLLPANLTTVNTLALQFSPAYPTHGMPLSNAAYAGYDLSLVGYTDEPVLYMQWNTAPSQVMLWIGLANFTLNRWDWYNPGDAGTLGFGDTAPYVSPTGEMLVQVVVLGNTGVELGWLRVGPAPVVWYVDQTADAGGNGLEWSTAFNDLQAALAAAQAGDEIWVAKGIYHPGSARSDTFALPEGVSVYGGFAGTETTRDERDWDANTTMLSGDLGVEDDFADNSIHVVTGADNAVLDGFTVSYGNADGSTDTYSQYGGGMYNFGCSPVVANCRFTVNRGSLGAGMYNDAAGPHVMDCVFGANNGSLGGGICNRNSSSPVIERCNFNDNSATTGGGMNNVNSSQPVVTGCTFRNNLAGDGGGLAVFGGDAQLTNCIFDGNHAGDGAGVYLLSCDADLTGCTFTSNVATALGGGINCDTGSSPILASCTFQCNSAGWGGGICSYQSSSPVLGNCDFNGNTAVNGGGAVFGQYTGDAKFFNCVISGNYSVYGGGVGSRDSTAAQFINCTICGNAAVYGGGFSNHSASAPVLVNCVLWANSASDTGPSVYSETGCTPQFVYSCLENSGGSGAGWNSAWGADGGGNIDTDPSLVRLPSYGADLTWGTPDDDYGDLHQQGGSPVIDSGNNAALPVQVTIDRDGNPRFTDDPATTDTGAGTAPFVDMGAYEFQP